MKFTISCVQNNFPFYLSVNVEGMSTNICLVSMVKAERDQVCDCLVSKSKVLYTVLLKRENVCYLKHNRHLASGNYFKFQVQDEI